MKLVHSISEAKEICSKDVKCFAIYDDGGSKERFLLCEIGAKIEMSNSGSVLYLKGTLFLLYSNYDGHCKSNLAQISVESNICHPS